MSEVLRDRFSARAEPLAARVEHGPRVSPGQRRGALLALFLAAFIWGTGYMAVHFALTEVGPSTLSLLRFLCALLVIVPLALRELVHTPRPYRLPLARLAVLGLIGIGLFYTTFNLALIYGSTVEAGLIFAVSPATTAALAVVFLRERVSGIRWIGIVLSVVGVGFIGLTGTAGGPDPILGGIVAAIGAVGWSCYIIVGKGLDPRIPQRAAMAVILLAGTLSVVPLAALELATQGQGPISATGWLLVLYLGAINTAAGYLLFNLGLRYVPASQSNTIIQLSTVVAVVSGIAVLGETLAPIQIAGGGAVLAGVWLATRPARNRTA